MASNKLTTFGFKCKHRLVDERMTMTELARAVHDDTGLFCDNHYLAHIFNGERRPKKIIDSVCRILDVTYED